MWEKLRVTFLKIQNADGNMEDAIEIVDMEEKISLGICNALGVEIGRFIKKGVV